MGLLTRIGFFIILCIFRRIFIVIIFVSFLFIIIIWHFWHLFIISSPIVMIVTFFFIWIFFFKVIYQGALSTSQVQLDLLVCYLDVTRRNQQFLFPYFSNWNKIHFLQTIVTMNSFHSMPPVPYWKVHNPNGRPKHKVGQIIETCRHQRKHLLVSIFTIKKPPILLSNSKGNLSHCL